MPARSAYVTARDHATARDPTLWDKPAYIFLKCESDRLNLDTPEFTWRASSPGGPVNGSVIDPSFGEIGVLSIGAPSTTDPDFETFLTVETAGLSANH